MKKLAPVFLIATLFVAAQIASAQGSQSSGPVQSGGMQSSGPVTSSPQPAPTSGGNGQVITLVNPLGPGVGLMQLLNKILDFVIQIGTIVVIFMLVWVGFLFVTASGNETKIKSARNALLWTVVGALILLGSKAIALGIEATVRALSVGQ